MRRHLLLCSCSLLLEASVCCPVNGGNLGGFRNTVPAPSSPHGAGHPCHSHQWLGADPLGALKQSRACLVSVTGDPRQGPRPPPSWLPVAGAAQFLLPLWGPEVLRSCQLSALGGKGRPAPVGKVIHWPHVGKRQGQSLGSPASWRSRCLGEGVAWVLLRLHPEAY